MTPKTTRIKRARAIDTGSFLFDEKLTRAALTLAGPEVRDEPTAAALFRDAAKGRVRWEGQLDQDSPTFDTSDWHTAQLWLRQWIPRIAASRLLEDRAAANFARELSNAIEGVQIGAVRLSRGVGRYELTMYARDDSIWKVCIRAILPFFPEYGWGHRLGYCHLPECHKWFLRDIKSGPPDQYCEPRHANLARIHRFRGKRA